MKVTNKLKSNKDYSLILTFIILEKYLDNTENNWEYFLKFYR